MKNYIKNLLGHIKPLIGTVLFAMLIIVSFFIFSYLIIIISIIGLTLFLVIYLRIKYLQMKYRRHAIHPRGNTYEASAEFRQIKPPSEQS